ncbi:MAG TPA: polysaccharide biosynthesis C-terminal domain-containing protein [Chitinophagaceae bacterium]|jgi:O-antigen/teichoic acid export membrane protein|nr:polysaccharide biosynthesis C-terminal domain-containing protein [Chitinophagaceae bacterium]
MSTIRRQSIISSVIVYFGFALGLFNTYLFTKKGGFTEEQYGLTAMFIAIANIMFSVASLGMPAYISKFYPYYRDRLKDDKNDLITWAMLIPCFGFLLVLISGLFFKNILVDKIFNNSPLLLKYYYWTFPFGFGLTIFLVLEAYLWQQRKAVLSNFTKEVLFRFIVTILIVLTTFHIIKDFDLFIKIYSFAYILLVVIILIYLIKNKRLHFVFKVSTVTLRFKNKIKTLISFVWAGGLVFNIANVFDTIVLAAVLPNGMAVAGVFTFAQNISSLLQAPQRAVVSASVGPLSQAWKEKNFDKINAIYKRSSINQLLFACALFCLVWLNFDEGIRTFGLKESYTLAKWVFFYIGLSRIIDMGTGVNAQIIGTSTSWRFEFLTGLILLALALPLNYFLTRYLGVTGPAISNLIAFSIYNLIRYLFLWNKYGMQPFTLKTGITILLAIAAYNISYLLFNESTGFLYIILRSIVFLILYAGGTLAFNLSEDVKPVWKSVISKLKL